MGVHWAELISVVSVVYIISHYSIVVRDDVISSRWVELIQGHRTSSSPLLLFHANNSRREEGCYVCMVVGMDGASSIICSFLSWGDTLW